MSLIQVLRQLALQFDFSDERAAPPTAVPPPRRTPPAATNPTEKSARTRQIVLAGTVLDYELRRSRRRSIGFLIGEEGLRVTAPHWVTLAGIESAIRAKEGWIATKLAERRERAQRQHHQHIEWQDGASLPYLGQPLRLRLCQGGADGIRYDAEQRELQVSLPAGAGAQQLRDRVQAWLQQQALQVFHERLPPYAERLGVRYQSVQLSSATTRWGSCTTHGKIRLNWRLIHFSPRLIDYVIAHELAHLREMNHGSQFWATVQSVFPDFAAARNELRRQTVRELPQF